MWGVTKQSTNITGQDFYMLCETSVKISDDCLTIITVQESENQVNTHNPNLN